MIAFIDDHREVHGVEPICKVLPITPSTYHAHVAKRTDPKKLSTRAKQDMALLIAPVLAENFDVYGVRKVWRQLQRESFDVARCTVEWLMQRPYFLGKIRLVSHQFLRGLLQRNSRCAAHSDHARRSVTEIDDFAGSTRRPAIIDAGLHRTAVCND